MSDDLQRRLEMLGSAEPDALSAERIGAIETRVMSTVATKHRRRAAPVLMAVAATVLVVVGAILLAVGGSEATQLEFADDVLVRLPGAAAVVGAAGDELPEDTELIVGPSGSAIVDGESFGPGRYVVIDGRPEQIGGSVTSSTTTQPSSRRDVEAPTTSIPTSGDLPETTSTTSTATTRANSDADVSATNRRADTGRTTSTSIRDRPTTTVRRETTTTSRPADRVTTTIGPDVATSTARTTTLPTTSSTTVPPETRDRSPAHRP